jgi:hypothetical protein
MNYSTSLVTAEMPIKNIRGRTGQGDGSNSRATAQQAGALHSDTTPVHPEEINKKIKR